jgi:PAS domain S-box-containing protein
MTDPRFTILIVDDDADARLLMGAAMRKAGFEVRLVESGAAGLTQFRAEPCDLVMLDVDMPDLNGHDVCATLRAEAGPLLPIVMVTGMDDVASVEAAYLHGATDFIAKPVNWALVGHRVRYLFRGHEAMRDLRAAEARNAAILNAIPDLLFELDIDGRYIDYRAPHANLLAAPAETLIGKTVREVLPAAAAEVCMSALRNALECGSSSGEQLELMLDKGRTWFELSVSTKAVAIGDKPRFIVLSRDITDRKVAEARIARLAYFDSLTGLPNRHAFLERVDRQIRRAGTRQEALALLFIDLDGFKNVNDSMGHDIGDLVLQWAAERLREGLRPTDVLSRTHGLAGDGDSEAVELARLGGDEFTAMLLDINRPVDAVAVAHRLGQLMRLPFLIEGRQVTLTASIGIALYPDDGLDAATLLKHADTAMYLAKRSGRDNAQLYSASLTHTILQRMELDASLRTALDREEFHLVYQPQIDAASGRMCAVEALIRWTHPTRGLVSPLEFIALAEENGLIGRIGQWVLRTACGDAARWSLAGQPLMVAVNLSPVQFANADLAQLVRDALAQTGLLPELLELEITEGALMENSAGTRRTLHALREQGVQIALDDFGTGYSSLAYLTRIPLSHIKVDRCFVAGMLDGGENEAVVRAVLAIASSLGLRVTAEGVETLAQAQALKALGCDSLQGFHFSRPVAADRIPALRARRWTIGPAGDAIEAGSGIQSQCTPPGSAGGVVRTA